ncbi:MAG TPA: TIGR03905 family protein [Lachnospiraceae bacterium]|nr:TIGR03905 family protein [Lachnospiraceae bacterium]
MRYTYKTKGTCSSKIEFDIDNDVITDVTFTGGCNGNLQAVRSLVDGLTVDQIEKKVSGIRCGMKPTSCPDQLAKAVREAYEATHA